MSKHVAISPEEAADRLAIRELVEAYAHCADRRDAKGQMTLFTSDTHFVVYMDAKDAKPSQELHSREGARSGLRGPEQVRRHHAFRRTEHDPYANRQPSHGRGLHLGPSPHDRRWKAKPDDCGPPVLRPVREDRLCLAVCGAPVVRRLVRGARTVMTPAKQIAWMTAFVAPRGRG
jgi:hypothetical protein